MNFPRRFLPRIQCRVAHAAMVATLFVCLGCSAGTVPTYPVSGRVIFSDGSPVRTGTVELSSKAHRINARGAIQRDGSFTLGTYANADGAVAGEHRVVVLQFLSAEVVTEIAHDHGLPVDARFAQYGTSGLTCVVKPDKNFMTFVVEPANR